MGRRKGLPIDGVLLLDKPQGISSNAALQRARRALGAAKAGHTGTLDPMASGLLPLAFGEATKFSQYLLDADKTYLAEVRLGVTTDTGDADGQVIDTSSHRPSTHDVAAACARFQGEIEQVPPMYSALKRDGKALYEYARAGQVVERQARKVSIHAIDLLAFDVDVFRCRVRCSKGTYIRALAEDIGQTLGCGAHLTALRRESTGSFNLSDAVSLERFEAMAREQRGDCLLPADAFVRHLPILGLDTEQGGRILHGQWVDLIGCQETGAFRLYLDSQFLGLGIVDPTGRLTSLRLLSS